MITKCQNVDKGRSGGGGGGSDHVDKDFFKNLVGLFKTRFGPFNVYLVVFGLFLPKSQ